MANEGGQDTGVVDGGTPSPEGVAKPEASNTNSQQETKSRDYERELAGIRADLQKERKARQTYEQQVTTSRAELDAERRRVQALAGVTVKSRDEQDDEAVRQAFAQKFPHLANLTQEDVQAMREMRQQQAMLMENSNQQWERHNEGVKASLRDMVSKEIGGDLSQRQMDRLVAAYVNEAEANPEFLQRHMRGDKSLQEEFAKQWVEDWFEPARRKVTQQEVTRARVVPGGKDRGIVTQGQTKIDVNDTKAVEDMLVKGFRERNGEFGRR